MLVSDGVLIHYGFQAVAPTMAGCCCQNLNPKKEFLIFSTEIPLFTFIGNTRISFFLLLVVDPGSHLVASLLGFFLL